MTAVRIPLSVPQIGDREAELLRQCAESGFVSSVGPFVDRFEADLAAFVGAAGAVPVASGTAALHLALLAVGVGPGDEVWVSDLTFVAPANAARYCGAELALVDAEASTWNLDPAAVAAELDRRAAAGARQPKAIVAVHVFGHPADLAPILEAAGRHGVPVVEDAAEALGATWTEGPLAGRQAGTAGTLGCLSFNGNKIMTTGGGGAVVGHDLELLARARHLSTQARVPGSDYRHDAVGFNYRMTSIAAAVGVAQLEQLDGFLARRREILAAYAAAFEAAPGITGPPRAPWAAPSGWLSSVAFADADGRDLVRRALAERGIEARPVWPAIRTQAPYAGATVVGGDTALALADRGLSLPSSATLRDDELAEVIDTVLAHGA